MDERCLQRAREFLRNNFVMDAHYDLAMDIDDSRGMGESRVYSAKHEEPFRAGGENCVVSSLFIHSWQLPEMGLRKSLDQISALMSEEREQPDKISLCASMADVDAANAAGRVGIIVSFEGADPLGSDIALLQVFHRLGVRALGLAWSRRNYAADGCSFHPLKEGLKGGLTGFGVELLEEAERLGMLIDISHLNDEGVSDAARFARRPFIASHSNCRARARSMRNLTDEQIKMVAESGGAIGMNGCSFAVADGDGETLGADDMFAHIDHIVRLVGDDFVGLGLDICDRLTDIHKSPPSVESRDTLKDHGQIARLAAVLFENGYSDERVGKILGGNFRRVFREVIG
jgi:membrane dipeptidase